MVWEVDIIIKKLSVDGLCKSMTESFVYRRYDYKITLDLRLPWLEDMYTLLRIKPLIYNIFIRYNRLSSVQGIKYNNWIVGIGQNNLYWSIFVQACAAS